MSGRYATGSEVLGRRGYYRGSGSMRARGPGKPDGAQEHDASGPAHCGVKPAMTEYLRQLLKVHGGSIPPHISDEWTDSPRCCH